MIIFYFIKWFWTIYISYIHTIINTELKTTITPIFFILFTIFSLNFMFAQNLELSINTKEIKNSSILKSIPHINKHDNRQSLLAEIDSISKKLQNIGFINNTFDITHNDSIYQCIYSLNNKIESIRVYYPNKSLDKKVLEKISNNYSTNFFDIQIENIEKSLKHIVNHYEKKGASFTSCSLKDLHQQNDKLFATLQIDITKERKINNIIIKGYADFPKKYFNHFISTRPNTTFNSTTLNKIDNLLKGLPFVTQLKKPEVLFTKDSTTIYIHLKKKDASKFDGILGFSNNSDSNKLNFTGNLNIELNNILNNGEFFRLNWNNNGENVQYLKFEINIPYIYNTKLSPTGSFTIFKQDSSYTNTKSQFHLPYSINSSNSIGITFSSENSNLTSSVQTNNLIIGFKNKFYGLNYSYKSLTNSHIYNLPEFFLNFKITTGNRSSQKINNHQTKIQLSTHYILKLDSKKSILFKNSNKILITDNFLQNELYRIGGINSIRGFNEQSIHTSKYTLFNTEFHHKLNQTSQFYTITDFAYLFNNISNSTYSLYGLGLGYFLTKKNSTLNLSYVFGNKANKSILLNNSKLHVKISYQF